MSPTTTAWHSPPSSAGQARALGHRAQGVLVERALVVERVDQDRAHASSFLSSSQDEDLLDRLRRVLVLDDAARLLGGRRLEVRAVGARVVVADAAGLDADVAGALGLERLLLRAHDRLERRVARLVDRVADGDDRRELDEHRVVAVLGLALAAELAVLHVDLDDLRERRHLQVVGDDGADRVALAVVGLLAQQDQVGRLGLEHLGQRVARAVDVGAGERLVREVHGAVGAERDGLVERAHRGLRAHRHRDDLVHRDRAALLELHGGLDGVRVEGVEVPLPAAVETPCRRVDALLDSGVRHFFDQDADLHGLLTPPIRVD